MFDRVELKAAARSRLKGNWGSAALVVLTDMVITVCLAKAAPSIICLIKGIVLTAMAYYFLTFCSGSKDDAPFYQDFIAGFSGWFHGLIGFLWSLLWVLLWSLLFVIPGIVKLFAYSQTLFLIAEYPDMPPTKAVRISKAITNGFKGDLFLMLLSFLGWIILSALTAGILLIWVLPYMHLTAAYTYRFLKETALRNGTIDETDLQ